MWSQISSIQRFKFSFVIVLFASVEHCVTQDIKCGDPAVPLNSKVTLSSAILSPGTTATYQCDEGYETFGTTTTSCSSAGKWVGEMPFCGINVAYRKPANQSTTAKGGSASNANDGDKSTDHEGKRCTETYKETSPWWQVNLLTPYPVKHIRITTRGCCGHQPLQELEIRVGNSSSQLQKNPLCAWFPGTIDEGVSKMFTCARVLVGQYVFIQLVGIEGSLSLCEVEVFSADEIPVNRCTSSGQTENLEMATFSQVCYTFETSRGSTFQNARTSCQKNKADLLHNMSPLQTNFIQGELDRWKTKLKTQLVWIGANKDPGLISRTWKWVDGEIIERPTWGKDQPNNYNGEQTCVVLDGGRDWLWNDVGCNLDYLHWICQNNPLTCGSPDKMENTTLIGNSYNVGSTTAYNCPKGHVLLGDKKRTCGKDGLWTGKAPRCKYVNCGPVPDVKHGSIVLVNETTTYDSVVVYSCNDNYTLVGEKTRSCSQDGTWSGDVPKCLFSICPEPPPVHGGIIENTGNKVGDNATYTCLPGYVIFGPQSLRCGLGGEWVGKPPFCKYVDCGFPSDIENGRYDLTNGTTIVGSIVEYTCSEDYWLQGERKQKCNREGKWSADAPSCQLITCDEPEVPPGSYVIGYDFNVHSKIEYNCEPGHKMIGESTQECQRDGEWSGSTPICEYIDCGIVPELNNGEVEYINSTTYLNTVVNYVCKKNHKLVGPVTRLCQDNKQWSGEEAKCEEIRCPEPVLPSHGIISVTGNDRIYGRTLIKTADSSHVGSTTYKVGALLKYRCERGYKVVGEPLSTCETTGQWAGDLPQCIYVDCKEPDKVVNGKVILPSNATYYGVLALYSCDDNFELDGVSRRFCQENGTWSSEPPRCSEKRCPDPDTKELATYVLTSRGIGSIVNYSCPKGYRIAGNSTRECLKNSIWSGVAPLCKAVNCSNPNEIQNGRIIVVNGTIYNSAIEYHCVPNFVRIGPYLRKCMENGKWSGEDPICEAITEEAQDNSNVGTNIGIGAGVLVFLLVLLGLIYFKLRKPVAVKNTENVEEAERKEDKNAAVMSYATLSDRNGHTNIYANIHDENLYDAPYESRSREGSEYEPEPVGRTNDNCITINGISVR